jgi:hypothetical protein
LFLSGRPILTSQRTNAFSFLSNRLANCFAITLDPAPRLELGRLARVEQPRAEDEKNQRGARPLADLKLTISHWPTANPDRRSLEEER